MIHVHDWFCENAYYVDSDIVQEHCGQARICLKCGKIELRGNVQMPKRFLKYQKNIRNGKDW